MVGWKGHLPLCLELLVRISPEFAFHVIVQKTTSCHLIVKHSLVQITNLHRSGADEPYLKGVLKNESTTYSCTGMRGETILLLNKKPGGRLCVGQGTVCTVIDKQKEREREQNYALA
jgi:hypothetical protein